MPEAERDEPTIILKRMQHNAQGSKKFEKETKRRMKENKIRQKHNKIKHGNLKIKR